DVAERPRPLAIPGSQTDRCLACAASGRPRRSLPVPSLRRRDAARRDDGGALGGRACGQDASDRIFGVVGRPDPRVTRALTAEREVRLLSAAVLAAPSRARARGLPGLR